MLRRFLALVELGLVVYVVNEEHAVQVVELVLKGLRQQSLP